MTVTDKTREDARVQAAGTPVRTVPTYAASGKSARIPAIERGSARSR